MTAQGIGVNEKVEICDFVVILLHLLLLVV
jgi:hypothetical protein